MEHYISVTEAAQRMGLDRTTVHHMLGRGELPYLAPSTLNPRGKRRIKPQDVDAWIAAHTIPAHTERNAA